MSVLQGTAHVGARFAEEPTMSNTTSPEASGQNESQPDPREVAKSESGEKADVGVEIGIMPEGEGSTFEPEEDPEAQG
jgi:hypothetical protein